MKITLRKANAVQALINEAINGLEQTRTVTLNEFQDVNTQVDAARDVFWKNHATRNSLQMALYEIRKKVANANAASGINDMLATVAYLDKQIGNMNTLISSGPRTDIDVVEGRLKKVREASADNYMYGRHEEVKTSIFDQSEIDGFKKTLGDHRKEKQALQDQLLEKNVQTHIELESSTAAFLQTLDIL